MIDRDGFRKPIRKISQEELREIMIGAALAIYDEAGRPYGDAFADVRRWFMEGGYEEECRRRQLGLTPERRN